MRKNKLGAMFVVSVLALTGIGITYAGFTDSISVYGTVNTATVDLVVEEYSCTYVWKVWNFDVEVQNPHPDDECFEWNPTDEIAIYTGPCINLDEYTSGWNNEFTHELVSWAKAEQGTDAAGALVDDSVKMTFHNLFPCIDFRADFIVHYVGSIPAKLTGPHYLTDYVATPGPLYDDTAYTGSNWMEDLWIMKHPYGDGTTDDSKFGIWFEAYKLENVDVDGDGVITSYDIGEPVDLGYQVHNCNYILFEMYIHLPQDNIFQGCSGTFNLDLGAIQWNEYLDDNCGPDA